MSSVVPGRILELNIPAERRIVQTVRDRFEEFIRPLRLTADEVDALKVALSEACTNAVCHGSPEGHQCQVHVRFEIQEDRLIIEIVDEGQGFQPAQIALPEYEEWKPSGRGLFLMQALMDDVQFEPTACGTCVRLTKLLPESATEAISSHAGTSVPNTLRVGSLQMIAYQDRL